MTPGRGETKLIGILKLEVKITVGGIILIISSKL